MDKRRLQYLDAMGIRVWERRDPSATGEAESQAEAKEHATAPRVTSRPESGGTISAAAAMSAASDRLDERAPNPRRPEPVSRESALSQPVALNPVFKDTVEPAQGFADWGALESAVTQCSRCDQLVANRTQTVLGTGDRQAQWMIIGEAPGAEEDRQGKPFVGRAGQLLNNMLQAIGLKREQVYIGNILKCRPPSNRDPRPEEVAACRAYLDAQIALIQPKVILVVGRIAAQELLRSDAPIGRLRGKVHRHAEGDIPVVVTYHPAYLLRSPGEKRKSWDDLRLALRTFRQAASR